MIGILPTNHDPSIFSPCRSFKVVVCHQCGVDANVKVWAKLIKRELFLNNSDICEMHFYRLLAQKIKSLCKPEMLH